MNGKLMTEPTAIQIAFRRNAQRRGLNDFIVQIKQCTEETLSVHDFVDPRESLLIESRDCDKDLPSWSGEADWTEIETQLKTLLQNCAGRKVVVGLSRYWDFALQMSVDRFVHLAFLLLMFDGDTVCTNINDFPLFAIDVFFSDIHSENRYAYRWNASALAGATQLPIAKPQGLTPSLHTGSPMPVVSKEV